MNDESQSEVYGNMLPENAIEEVGAVAVALILCYGRKIVIVRRVGSPRWQYPNTVLEAGETYASAAARIATLVTDYEVVPENFGEIIRQCRHEDGILHVSMRMTLTRDEEAQLHEKSTDGMWEVRVVPRNQLPEYIHDRIHRAMNQRLSRA